MLFRSLEELDTAYDDDLDKESTETQEDQTQMGSPMAPPMPGPGPGMGPQTPGAI